ncbi:unnamed protein product, partial [Discosporangium mesarthrocarpum]
DISRILDSDGPEANFSNAFVGDEACRNICDALSNNSSKTRVFLASNCIHVDGASAVANMLKANSSVALLNLEWNSIGNFERGVECLASALEVNRSLTSLVLCNNNISQQGAAVLARALHINNTLKDLDLRWNHVGNPGARALHECLEVNKAISTIKLSGNNVDIHLLENLEAALQDRDSGILAQKAIRDDLHLTRERNEQLEACVRRQRVQEEEKMHREQVREQQWQSDLAKLKEEGVRVRRDTERQLEASAKEMAVLEEQLIHERLRADDLKSKLGREGERRQAVQEELDKTKQVLIETKRDLSRRVEKLQDALDAANEDRRITQGQLEHMRDVLEGEVGQLKEELRASSAEGESLRRAQKRAVSEVDQAGTLLETARTEARLLKDSADEVAVQAAKAAQEARQALEDTRHMYEERLEALRAECQARARAAEERCHTAEQDRQRVEASRQASQKELTRLQVSMEERLSQNERRAVAEAQKKFDLELIELRERIEAVQKAGTARDLQEQQAKEYLASLEDLRTRSATEAREYGRELTGLRGDVERAWEGARAHEGQSSKLQTEVNILQRSVEGLQQRLLSLERDKQHSQEVSTANAAKVIHQS